VHVCVCLSVCVCDYVCVCVIMCLCVCVIMWQCAQTAKHIKELERTLDSMVCVCMVCVYVFMN